MKSRLKIVASAVFLSCVVTAVGAADDAVKLKKRESMDFDAAAERIVFVPYTGTNAQYKQMWETLQNSRKRVLQEIYQNCGLTLPVDKKVRVAAKDLGSGKGLVYGISYPQGYGALLHYSMRNVLRGRQKPLDVLRHELTHALQESWMGGNLYWRNLPSWFHEGLATYAGGHGEERLNRFKKYGTSVINGLASHTRPQDYLEDYLGFLYIEKTWGHDALKRFVRDVTLDLASWEKSLKEITQMDKTAFYAGAKTFALDYIRAWGKGQIAAQPKPPQTAATPPPPQPVIKSPPPPQSSSSQEIPARPKQPPSNVVSSQKPDLGFYLMNITDNSVLRTLPSRLGVRVVAVMEEGSAARSRIVAGDILISFKGKPTPSVHQFQATLDYTKPGDIVEVQVYRAGKIVTLRVTVGAE